jgi:hypothetical protein
MPIVIGVALVGVRLCRCSCRWLSATPSHIASHGSEVADGAVRGDIPLVRELGAVDREAVVVEQDVL